MNHPPPHQVTYENDESPRPTVVNGGLPARLVIALVVGASLILAGLGGVLLLVLNQQDDIQSAADSAADNSEQIARIQQEGSPLQLAIKDAIEELTRNSELQTSAGAELTAIDIACAISILADNGSKIPPTAVYATQIRDCAADVKLKDVESPQ